METKTVIKILLRQLGFEPYNCNWREFFNYGGIAKKGTRLYRFRSNAHEFSGGDRRWTVDVSCELVDFDRWANSTENHAVSFNDWVKELTIDPVMTP
jgi:hypothetical protein